VLYDGWSFVSQTAQGHLDEDNALVALELAHGGPPCTNRTPLTLTANRPGSSIHSATGTCAAASSEPLAGPPFLRIRSTPAKYQLPATGFSE